MKNLYLLPSLFLLSFSLWGQSPALAVKSIDERTAVIGAIQHLFDAMRAGDSTALRQVLTKDAGLNTTFTDREGNPRMVAQHIDKFAESVGTPHEEVYDEKIWSYRVEIDDRLATVWTDYTFYLGEKMRHCGVNAFQLFKSAEGWKIFQISDTRRRNGCQTEVASQKDSIGQLLDAWHMAAAKADAETFFGTMSDDAIYIGTDTTEHWTKPVFRKWSKRYFERESAWDFKAISRNIFLGQEEQMAWFDELLDTWMGPCRASGILHKEKGEWKITHYHLSLTVPNDQLNSFIELMKKK